MSVAKRLSIIVALALVVLTLGLVGYSNYDWLMKKTELLEKNLEDKDQTLEVVEGELSKAKQKNILFATEKESLDKEIALQKEQITGIRQTNQRLQKQQKTLSAKKQELENTLAETEQLYRKQAALRKLKDQAKEESSKERAKKKELEFFAEKEELEKQIESVKAELEKSVQKNQEFLDKLDESSQMIIKLRLEQGEEGNQLIPISQEDKQFQKELLKFHYNAGLAYDQNQQFELALTEYEKALKAVPDDPDTHYNLAVLYDQYLLDKKKAIEHYQTYLTLNPNASDTIKVNYWIREAKKELR